MKNRLFTLGALLLSFACSKQSSNDLSCSYEDLKGSMGFVCVIDNATNLDTKSVDDNIWNNLEQSDGKIALPDEMLPSTNLLSLSIEGEYIIPDEDLGIQVDGGPTEKYSLSGLTLGEYNADLPYLYGGDYTLTLTYGEPTDEGYNKPYFYGECDFTIYGRKSDTKSTTVELSNSIIRAIETTEYFDNYYTSAEFTITTSQGNSISLDPGIQTLYFVEAGTTLTLSGSAVKSNGYTVTFSGEIGKTEANSCYTITVDAENVAGNSISVNFNDDTSLFDIVEIDAELNPDNVTN